MTYCLAIQLESGLVFASDSRTNAGADQVSTYSKMHRFELKDDRVLVLLTAGNLATTQAVLARLRRHLSEPDRQNLNTVGSMVEAAEYLGQLNRDEYEKHDEALSKAGFRADASFIIGGQFKDQPPELFLVYPQGNFITTSRHTRFLQIGESKYGKPILDRIIDADTRLEDALRCALVSIDSTMRSNVTVGPPLEALTYTQDTLKLGEYLCLEADDDYLLELRRAWHENIKNAFRDLPPLPWEAAQNRPHLGAVRSAD